MFYSDLKFIDEQTNAVCHTQEFYADLKENYGLSETDLMLFQILAKENYRSADGVKPEDYFLCAREFTTNYVAKETLRRFLKYGLVKSYEKKYVAILPDKYVYRENGKNAVVDSVKDFLDTDVQNKTLREALESYLTLLFNNHVKVDPVKFHYELCKMLRNYGVSVVLENVSDAILTSSVELFTKSTVLPDYSIENDTEGVFLAQIKSERERLEKELQDRIRECDGLMVHNKELVSLLSACEDNRKLSEAEYQKRNDELSTTIQTERTIRAERENQIAVLNQRIEELDEKIKTLRGRAKDASAKEAETSIKLAIAGEQLDVARKEIAQLKEKINSGGIS